MDRLSTALGQPVWENLVLVCVHLVSIQESPMQISHPVNKNYMFIYISYLQNNVMCTPVHQVLSQSGKISIYTCTHLHCISSITLFSFGSVSLRHKYTNKMSATVKVIANKAGKR